MNRTIVLACAGLALTGCAQTERMLNREPRALVRAPELCVDQTTPIYFAPGSAALSQPARTLIADTAQRLRDCRIVDVRVTGLADSSGTPEANLAVSQKRAEAVVEALAGEGLPAPAIELAAAGDAGRADAPMRRRAEILIRARPR
jgi:outer membrane protein OmpA-like peptidoglycan-associated protein